MDASSAALFFGEGKVTGKALRQPDQALVSNILPVVARMLRRPPTTFTPDLHQMEATRSVRGWVRPPGAAFPLSSMFRENRRGV